MKIIGLTGAMGSGKDTAADFIKAWCESHGFAYEREAFADRLKISAAAAFGIPRHEAVEFCNWLKQPGVFVTAQTLEGNRKYKDTHGKRVTGRQFLQFYGTEGHRDVFARDFWTDVMDVRLGEMAGIVDVVALTDCRFPNEAEFVHKHGGEVWLIERPGAVGDQHVSEAGLPVECVDRIIANAGDLEDFKAMVEMTCEARL